MRITAKADYAVRAAAELAAAWGSTPLKAEDLAARQRIPAKFLSNILSELRRGGIVQSRRGSIGGYELSRPPAEITLADVIRAVEGPLATVHDSRPEKLDYDGAAEQLQVVWIALRAGIREVLEHVSLEDLAAGRLPARISALAAPEDAWRPH